MPAQMSHVNKLLAAHKQQQKEGILVLFPTHEFTPELELKYFKKGGDSLFCQEVVIHRSSVLKIKGKNKKGIKVPGSMPPQAAEIRSSHGEKQGWWAQSRVTAALEAAGLSCHFRGLLHADTFEHGHLDSLLSWREARLQRFHPLLLPRRKKEGLYAECLPPSMWVHLSNTAVIKKRNTGRRLPSSPSFITKGNHCFFHYYFLSSMTINTLQRITHQWKAIQRILH